MKITLFLKKKYFLVICWKWSLINFLKFFQKNKEDQMFVWVLMQYLPGVTVTCYVTQRSYDYLWPVKFPIGDQLGLLIYWWSFPMTRHVCHELSIFKLQWHSFFKVNLLLLSTLVNMKICSFSHDSDYGTQNWVWTNK